MAGFAGACDEAGGETLFVFKDEALEEAFASGYGVEGFEVEFAQSFDVDGSAVLRRGKMMRWMR